MQIATFPSDMSVTEGEGVCLKIKVSGMPHPTVTWYHDEKPIRTDSACEIEADGSLAIPSTELKHSGVYKAVVANKCDYEERMMKLSVEGERESSTSATNGDKVSTRPIPVLEFGKYVAELHTNSNKPFKDLYQVCVNLLSSVNNHFSDKKDLVDLTMYR